MAVVTGVDDAFCAGGDLRDYLPVAHHRLVGGSPDDRARFRSGTEAVLRDLDIYKPIIAAVNGPCVAGGMELLNGTDIRLACPEAVFGMLEPQARHLRQRRDDQRVLPRQIPWAAAMEFLLTAEPVPGDTRRWRWDCSTRSCPGQRLLDRAYEWAARITENAPLAVAATKESALRGLAAESLADAMRIEARLSARVLTSNDAREGPLRVHREARTPLDRHLSREPDRGSSSDSSTTIAMGRLVFAW